MSVRVMSAVWHEATQYREGPLLVLLALADWANDDGWCWPSVPAIAQKARLTERQVYNVITGLERDGVLHRIAGGGRGKPTRYRVLVAALRTPEPSRGNPEMASGFPAVEKRGNGEAGFMVSARRNPEMDDAKTLKLDASPIGRTVREPSTTTKPPVVPHADARGTRPADFDSACAFRPHVDAVMQGCGFTTKRLRRVIAGQLAGAEARGTPAPTAALRMIAAWRDFSANRALLRYDWKAANFFGEGHWREDSAQWPWDHRAAERAGFVVGPRAVRL